MRGHDVPAQDPTDLHLLVADGPARGKAFPLTDSGQTALLVGRSKDCDCQLLDPRASRKHFCIYFRKGDWWIRDLESSNGTLVNECTVLGEVALAIGDSIQAGDTKLHLATESMLRADSANFALDRKHKHPTARASVNTQLDIRKTD